MMKESPHSEFGRTRWIYICPVQGLYLHNTEVYETLQVASISREILFLDVCIRYKRS
jgi:hypothetical protein